MHAPCKCWQVSIKESYCLLWSFCMYESAKNELKENNNGFGYLFDVNISWIFFKTCDTQAATPPAKWITHGYLANQIYWIANCEPTDQPAQNILLLIQFCSILGWQVKRPSNVAVNLFFTLHPQCKWLGMKESDPIFWAHVRSNTHLTLRQEMFIAQQ